MYSPRTSGVQSRPTACPPGQLRITISSFSPRVSWRRRGNALHVEIETAAADQRQIRGEIETEWNTSPCVLILPHASAISGSSVARTKLVFAPHRRHSPHRWALPRLRGARHLPRPSPRAANNATPDWAAYFRPPLEAIACNLRGRIAHSRREISHSDMPVKVGKASSRAADGDTERR